MSIGKNLFPIMPLNAYAPQQPSDDTHNITEIVPFKYNTEGGDGTGVPHTTTGVIPRFIESISDEVPQSAHGVSNNIVHSQGWNVDASGTREIQSAHSVAFRQEYMFLEPGGGLWAEQHWEVWFADGTKVRPISQVVDVSTKIGQVGFESDSFTFDDRVNGQSLKITHGRLQMTNSADAELVTVIRTTSSDYVHIGQPDDTLSFECSRIQINAGTHLLAEGANFQILGDGVEIGTANTQKLGFWGADPVAQHSSTGEATGFTANLGVGVQQTSTFTGNRGGTAYTISDVVKALKLCGIMAE